MIEQSENMIQPTLFNLDFSEYSQEFHYYPFVGKLDQFVASYNTLNDLASKVCVPNKTEGLNLSVFNLIRGINESKKLAKHILCKCKCRFDTKKCMSDQGYNNNKCWCECKKHLACEKDYIWNPAAWSCENAQHLASTVDDSAITCDEIIEAGAEAK